MLPPMWLRAENRSYIPSPDPRTSHFSSFFLLIRSGKFHFCSGETKMGAKHFPKAVLNFPKLMCNAHSAVIQMHACFHINMNSSLCVEFRVLRS